MAVGIGVAVVVVVGGVGVVVVVVGLGVVVVVVGRVVVVVVDVEVVVVGSEPLGGTLVEVELRQLVFASERRV